MKPRCQIMNATVPTPAPEPNPIAQFNAAFAYHFAEHVTPDAHTLQLMAEFALRRGRGQLHRDLLTLLESQH